MIASRSSFAGFLNFSCEYSAMYCTESEPNWSPVACGERAGVIKEHADLDRLSLGIGGAIRRGDQEGHADEDQRRNHSPCLHVAGPPRGKGWLGQKPSQR